MTGKGSPSLITQLHHFQKYFSNDVRKVSTTFASANISLSRSENITATAISLAEGKYHLKNTPWGAFL